MMKVMSMFAVVSVALALALPAASGESGEWSAPARAAKKKNPMAADAASIAAGKTVYERECQSCHGVSGKGDGPEAKNLERPAGDLSSAKTAEQSDGALFWKTTAGKKPMPTFEKLLSDEERWQVVNYIRTFVAKPEGGAQ